MYKTLFLEQFSRYIKNMGYYYAVAKGRTPGIYGTWDECKAQVHQYVGAKYKKFSSQAEAQAFVDGGSSSSATSTYSKNTNAPYTISKNRKPANQRQYSTSSENDKSGSTTSDLNSNLKLVGRNYFQVDDDGYVNVWTDGACSKNGRKNAKAGIGAFFGFEHPLNISRPVDTRSTNNYAEIKAVTEAAKEAFKNGVKKLKINTDSQFLINCANLWMPKWKKNNWKNTKGDDVINKLELIEMEKELVKFDSINWNHVRGHQGNTGNEMADQLARMGAEQN